MAPDAAPKPPPTLESEAITHRPPNQMGLPTPATIGNRMGMPSAPRPTRSGPRPEAARAGALSPGAR